ncbi:MAG TPA: hypothetical protein VGD90_08360 [Sphingobacteriaceae bacterium]
MRRILSTFLLTMITTLALADERTDVIILGNNPSAMAAGIQSARSGVKTTWISPTAMKAEFSLSDTLNGKTGIWAELLKHVKANPETPGEQLLKGFTDTIRNLTIIQNGIRKIERAGKGWEVKLINGRELKCQVLVDAENHIKLFDKAPETLSQQIGPAAMPSNLYSNRLYRTSISTGQEIIPLASLISKEENYIVAPSKSSVPASILAGQAAGASAAYCAYFKTTTRHLSIRMTQGELLRYSGTLLPATDVQQSDTGFISIQHILATGIMKLQNGAFNPEKTLNSEELRLPMKEFYSRSQLWFFNNKKDTLTIQDAVNLIMFTANRGEELRREIDKGWISSLKLTGVYDPKRAITRRELAVLIDRYLQPFSVRVDFVGNLLR